LTGQSEPKSGRRKRGSAPPTRAEVRRRETRGRSRRSALLGGGFALVAAIGLVTAFVVVPDHTPKPSSVIADRTSMETAVTAVASATVPSSSTAASSTSTATTRAAAAASGSAGALPFDMPSTATLRASRHKVFAHYMPVLPISLDNKPAAGDYYTKKYLDPNGEYGRHKSYGGFLRDRPLPVAPGGTDWQLRNARTAVAQATAAGVDGFAWDLQSLSTSSRAWVNGVTLMKAAAGTGFKIALTPDMGVLKGASAASMAAGVAKLAAYPAAYRLGDGRLVVMPFLGSSGSPVTYWRQFNSIMASTYGIKVALVPIFLNEVSSLPSFRADIYGASNWGARNPSGNNTTLVNGASALGRASNVMKTGKLWMQPVSVQDERPRVGTFEEAMNSQNLRNSWQVAIKSKADWAQLATWNDYSEGSQMDPSLKRNWANLDISAYYLAQYKTGAAPKIVRDTVYVSHRTQPYAARPSFPQSILMHLARGVAPVNRVEALGFLTAPGYITVTSGSNSKTCSVPAGVQTCTVTLAPGKVTARISRSSAVVTSVTSPFSVTNAPYVQDLQYVAASSRRNNDGSPKAGITSAAPPPAAAPASSKAAAVGNGQADGAKPAAAIDAKAITLVARGGATPATSYLRFNVPATPAGKKLVSAALQIHTTTAKASVTGSASNVYLAGNTWQESSLTWKAKPAVTTQLLGALSKAPTVDTTYAISLNVATMATLAGTQRTFAITGSSADSLLFRSRKNAYVPTRPTLVLTYQ
jgi:Glycosyl hydrolase family 71